tara:strand:+ start:64 stop:1056 length:993 start_codon:yes stop_codon:yes gene_type:complete
MDTKVCSKCKTEKPVSEYYKDKRKKSGLYASCKRCFNKTSSKSYQRNIEKNKEIARKYRIENKEQINNKAKESYQRNIEKNREKAAEYRKKNKEQIKLTNKKYSKNNRDKINEYRRKWREINKDELKPKRQKYLEENKEKISELRNIYKKKNKDKIKETDKIYREKNSKHLSEKKKIWLKENQEWVIKYREENRNRINKVSKKRNKERRKTDHLYKLRNDISTLIRMTFKYNGYKKNTKSAKILGCSFEELKYHLEKQFTEGMSWDNRGKWQIDHIIPVASAINEEELFKLNHYTNLQPMWGKENIKKSDNFNEADKKKYLEWYSKNVIN